MITDSSYNTVEQKIKYQIVNVIAEQIKNEQLKSEILNHKKDLFKAFESIEDLVSFFKENKNQSLSELLIKADIASAIFQDLNLGKANVGDNFDLTRSGITKVVDLNLMKATNFANVEQINDFRKSEYGIDERKKEFMENLLENLDSSIKNNPKIEQYFKALSIMKNNRSHELNLEHKEFIENANIPNPEKIIFGEENVLILYNGGFIKSKPISFVEDLDIFDTDYKDTHKHEYLLIDDLEIQTLNLSTRINVNFQYFDENDYESKTAYISYDLAQAKFMTNAHFDSLDFTDSDIKKLEEDVIEQVKRASLEYIKEQSFKHTDVACKVSADRIPVYVAPMAEISNTDFKGTLLSFNHYHNDIREQYYNIDGNHQELHFTEMSSRKAELALKAFDYTYHKFDNVIAVKNNNNEDCSLYKIEKNRLKVIEASELSFELRDKFEDRGFSLPELRTEKRDRKKSNRL
ncbi:hypothetical protein ACRZ5S_19875 [Vibrio scophthalmi]|uniref:hypothetical protein n=1 Tax=Vibrio scophthalmi TaxID=45658 RepID=UPI003EC06E7D